MSPKVDKVAYECTFCDKVYTYKSSLQTHVTKKHKEKVEENKNMTNEALVTSSIIMNEIVENAMNDNYQKKPIDPNDQWLESTNSDLTEMLALAEANLENPTSNKSIIDITDDDQVLDFEEVEEVFENSYENKDTESDNKNNDDTKCNVCGEHLDGETPLIEHVNSKHLDEKCRQCENYKQVESFKDLALEKKQETIDKLGAALKKMAHAKKSLVGENKAIRERLNEAKCKITEPSITKVYVCEICDFESASKDGLKCHIHCSECAISFKTMDNLNTHIQNEHVNEILSECGKKACKQTQSTMKAEIRMLKTTLDENVKLVQETIDKSNEKDEGNKTKNNVRKENAAIKEVQKDLDNARKIISEKEKRLSMLMVEITTKDAKIEILEKESPFVNHYTCYLCHDKFSMKEQFDEHMKAKHNLKIFSCHKCGGKFSCKTKHKDHIHTCTKSSNNQTSTSNDKTSSSNDQTPSALQPDNSHANVQSQQSTNNINHAQSNCRNGLSCRFLRENRCKFYHAEAAQPDGNEWQSSHRRQNRRPRQRVPPRVPSSNVQWCKFGDNCHRRFCEFKHYDNRLHASASAPSNGVQWCKFGDNCHRGSFCNFKHYNVDFPPLAAQRRQ